MSFTYVGEETGTRWFSRWWFLEFEEGVGDLVSFVHPLFIRSFNVTGRGCISFLEAVVRYIHHTHCTLLEYQSSSGRSKRKGPGLTTSCASVFGLKPSS